MFDHDDDDYPDYFLDDEEDGATDFLDDEDSRGYIFDDEDDEYPDYFLADDEAPKRRATIVPVPVPLVVEHKANDAEQPSKRRISFADNAPRRVTPAASGIDEEDDDETAEREDNDAPLKGCCSGWFIAVLLLGLVVVAAVGYFRYLSPVVDDATMPVNVVNLERRGVFFKTYEAEIVDPRRVADTEGVYTHPRSVSVRDAAVAERLRRAQRDGAPVEIRYEVYSATLPWRGESKIVVVDVLR